MRRLTALGIFALALAACSSSQPFALVASSPGSIATGEQRLLVGLLDPESQAFLAAPDVAATATMTGPSGQTLSNLPLDFVWTVPDERGLYRLSVDFDEPGAWTMVVASDAYPATDPVPVIVSAEIPMPDVGDVPPIVATPTFPDAELATISSDLTPDPELYTLSLDEIVDNGRPAVIVFATPAFCTTQSCGPVLDLASEIRPEYPGVDFLHIEIYENLDAPSLEDLVPVAAVEEWALPSEPWVYVLDSDGIVTARFEGTFDRAEMATALAGVVP